MRSRILLAVLTVETACTCGRDDGRLRLDFEPIEHASSFSLMTDFKFLPSPADELLVSDRDGGLAHMRLVGDEVELLMEARVDDVYVERTGATGILGLAVDPDFATNRHFYAAMTLSRGHVVVRRYTLHSDPEATTGSHATIVDLRTPKSPRWHNIASMGFDEAGVMWVLVGDKGLFEPAQDPANLLGSLVRILPKDDRGYATPADAALHSPGANPAVYAIGLRSPWRGLYHEGRWFVGDVGDRFEEVNVVDGPGMNFGWPRVEGPCEPSDRICERYTDPWESYGRSNSETFVVEDPDAVPTTSRSVYVGWIYKPRESDPYEGRFDNVLTFGDTYVGFVRGKRVDRDEPSWHVGHLPWATGWDQGPDGHVYVTTLGGWPPPRDGSPGPKSGFYRAVLAR